MTTREILRISLSAAVPLWILKLKTKPWSYIEARQQECADIVASKGDIIQFKSKKKGETAEAFNGLAEGLACLAFAPGGVTFLGDHWEATHPEGHQPGPDGDGQGAKAKAARLARRRATCQSHAECTTPGLIDCEVHVPCGQPTTHIVLVRSDSPLVPARMLSCERHVAMFPGAYDWLPTRELEAMETAFGDLRGAHSVLIRKLLGLIALDVDRPDPEAMEHFERGKMFIRDLMDSDGFAVLLGFVRHSSNPLRYYGHPDHQYLAKILLEEMIPFYDT